MSRERGHHHRILGGEEIPKESHCCLLFSFQYLACTPTTPAAARKQSCCEVLVWDSVRSIVSCYVVCGIWYVRYIPSQSVSFVHGPHGSSAVPYRLVYDNYSETFLISCHNLINILDPLFRRAEQRLAALSCVTDQQEVVHAE